MRWPWQPDTTKEWMCTFSGVQYFPAAPHPDDVRIIDIAHHLSRLCRFTGAISTEHYSVAEHSVHVSYVVPQEHAFAGLMHDAPEAYLNDINRPAKRNMPDYTRLEALNWKVIAIKFGLPLVLPECVHYADNAVLNAERDALMPQMSEEQRRHWPQHPPADVVIRSLAPNAAKALFIDRFVELTGRAYKHGVLKAPYPVPAWMIAGNPA